MDAIRYWKMKIKISILVSGLLLHSIISAQQLNLLGAKIGYVKCQLIGDADKNIEGEGFHGGLFSQLPLQKKVNLQAELLYAIKGCNWYPRLDNFR